MSAWGHERRPFKWRLLDDFRYSPGSDRGSGAAQYVAKGHNGTLSFDHHVSARSQLETRPRPSVVDGSGQHASSAFVRRIEQHTGSREATIDIEHVAGNVASIGRCEECDCGCDIGRLPIPL